MYMYVYTYKYMFPPAVHKGSVDIISANESCHTHKKESCHIDATPTYQSTSCRADFNVLVDIVYIYICVCLCMYVCM